MEGMESSENYRNYMEIMCLIELMYRRVSVTGLRSDFIITTKGDTFWKISLISKNLQ